MSKSSPTPQPHVMTLEDVDRIREHFPAEMILLPQWVPYSLRWKENTGKFDKIPMNPNTGYNAKSNQPETWGSFDVAVKRALNRKLGGVGFVFSEDDPFVGVDLDKCINGSGEVEPWASDIISELNSYTELSPSGKGFHILGLGKLPPRGRRKDRIEMYDSNRFFTVTGIVNGNCEIRDIQDVLTSLHERVFKKSQPKGRSAPPDGSNPTVLTDDAVIAKAIKSKGGNKFEALWRGDWEGSGYPSQSEADQALCNLLAWWTNYDANRLDGLFRQSGLFRPEKWDKPHFSDGRTYGSGTIETAIEGHSPGEGFKANPVLKKPIQQKKKRLPIKVGGYYLTELGNAERLVHKYGIDLHFCHEWSKWLVWDGSRWIEDKRGAVDQMAKETVRAMYTEAKNNTNPDVRELLLNHAQRSESANKLRAMVNLATSESNIPVLSDELDQHSWHFTVNNGTIDLRTGMLCQHKRNDLITKLARVDFDPDAKCPVWQGFLEQIMAGNKALITFLQRAVGYSLTGDVSEQVLFFLYGKGANGKTTFLKTILDLVDNYGRQSEPGLLIQKNVESHPTGLAELLGSRFVSTTEVEEGRRMAETLVKQMTGGDRQKGRFMRQDWFEFEPTFKLWLAANHRPVIRSTDYGIWRRIRLIPFEVTISPKDQDKSLLKKLKSEFSGILAWAVKGCLDWQREGLSEPAEVTQATSSYKTDMDILGSFIADRCVVHPDALINVARLYAIYIEWCESNKEVRMSKRQFGSQLDERGLVRRRGAKGIRLWTGIGEGDATGDATNTAEMDFVDPEDIDFP